jgi:hypothetical protein
MALQELPTASPASQQWNAGEHGDRHQTDRKAEEPGAHANLARTASKPTYRPAKDNEAKEPAQLISNSLLGFGR